MSLHNMAVWVWPNSLFQPYKKIETKCESWLFDKSNIYQSIWVEQKPCLWFRKSILTVLVCLSTDHWLTGQWFSNNTRANYSQWRQSVVAFSSGVENSIIDRFRSPQWIGIVKLEKIDSSSWVGVTAAEDLVVAITSIHLNDFVRWWSVVLLVIASLLYITLVVATFNGKQNAAV